MKNKKCYKCNQIKNIADFRTSKGYLSNICKECELKQAVIRNYKIKFSIIKDHYDGYCLDCKKPSNFLPIMEFHHPNTQLKSTAWRKLKGKTYQTIVDVLQNENVVVLCRNCHTLRGANFFRKFKNLILSKEIFKQSYEELDESIKNYILKQPDTYQKLNDNRNYVSQSKYRIRNNWLKKRFIIEKLFNGICIGCELINIKNNLPALNFHHTNPIKKENLIRWQEIAHLDLVKLEEILVKETCICLCANCHVLIESNRFLNYIDKIFEEPLASNIKYDIFRIHQNIKNFNNKISY